MSESRVVGMEPVELPADVPGYAERPPTYSLVMENELTREAGSLQANGRIDVNLESKVARTLAKIIELQQEDIRNPPPDYIREVPEKISSCEFKLNIVIQIVGSRGDVQPFVALGSGLKKDGHRVRIATHDVFADFVHEAGLEFYPIGGDPAELMAFMVKNPGLIPQMKTLRDGEIRRKQTMMATMLEGCWRSCLDDDPYTKIPFIADAIIANPPSFAHIHCAQAMSIPVHLMFTMPWSSTKAFPHPLANLYPSNMETPTANWVSYGVVEWLTWQGLGDVINKWRVSIGLDPISSTEGPGLAEALKVPFTYCWSPALVPQPQDWPSHIDVCGFFFREPPPYTPSTELVEFLKSGPPPVYIGFGSIVVDDSKKLIDTVLNATSLAGVRAIVSSGWSKLAGISNLSVFYIQDCPHEWLFQHVAAVVHHGGAGTTACGLKNGVPTAIVPFFGDQPFWGHMIARSGAGPSPLAHATLTPQALAAAIQFCLTPEAKIAALQIAEKMQTETGVLSAVESFYNNLPRKKMKCKVLPAQVAGLIYKKGKRKFQLSKVAAQTLIESRKIEERHLRSAEINPIYIQNRRWDSLTAVLSASIETGSKMLSSTGEMIYNPYKEYRRGRAADRSEEQGLRVHSAPARRRPSSHSSEPLPRENLNSSTPDMLDARSIRGQKRSPLAVAGNMVGATLGGFGKFTATYFKGVVVDIPYAAAEGFRQAPRLYGEQPKEYEAIKDWRTGAIYGGRNFVDGITDGFTDLFTQPVKGAREEGVAGAAKGFFKGTLGLATKVPSAGLGLVAYPFHGITKSIDAALSTKNRKAILSARLKDAEYQTGSMNLTDEDKCMIIERFERVLRAENIVSA